MENLVWHLIQYMQRLIEDILKHLVLMQDTSLEILADLMLTKLKDLAQLWQLNKNLLIKILDQPLAR